MADRRRPSARSGDLLKRLFGGTMAPEPALPKPPRLLVFKPRIQRELTVAEREDRRELAEWFSRRLDDIQREGRLQPFTVKVTKRKATSAEWDAAMQRLGREWASANHPHQASGRRPPHARTGPQ